MTPNIRTDEKYPETWPLLVATSFYILKPTKQARFSVKMSNTIGLHGLYVSFSPLYVSFCTLKIRLSIEVTESFLNSVAVVPYGLVNNPTDGSYTSNSCLVRKKYE